MSDSEPEPLTCPECGEPLEVDEEWVITDPALVGTTVEGGESIQGDYAHADCRPVASALAEVHPL